MPARVKVIAALLFICGFLNDPPWKGYGSHLIGVEPIRIARSVALTGEFADPFVVLATGPTAHAAPGYPYIVGGLLTLFDEIPNGWLAVRLLATTALSLQFALLPWVARVFGFSVWTGALAGLFAILVKPAKQEFWEAHLAGLLVMLLAVAMVRTKAAGTKHVASLAGVSFLVQPVLAAVYYVWALPKRRLGLLLIPLAICLPWILRNYVVLGGVTFIRDDLGLEMAVSFNDCAPHGIRESEKRGCFPALHPNTNFAQAQALRDEGEIAYNRRRLGEALGWIATHPGRTTQLVIERIWFFWFPSDFGLEHYANQRMRLQVLHLFTVASLVGLWLALRRGLAGARVLALWLAVFPLVYYLMQFEERYRYPILWITFLVAAYVAQVLGSALYSRRHDHTA